MKAGFALGLMMFFTIIAAGGGWEAATGTGLCGGIIGAIWSAYRRR